MLTKMIETLKKNPRTIVYTEGTDKRILESAHRLTQEGILGVVLLGKPEEVKAAAKAGNFNIDACQIIDPENYDVVAWFCFDELKSWTYSICCGICSST